MNQLDGMNYSAQEWKDAYEAAKNADWCAIDAREQGGGELAAVVVGIYEDHENVGRDEDKLYAAINALEEEMTAWAPEFLRTVLDSYVGESEDDMAKVATDYIDEHWPGFPVDTISDLEAFAHTYAIPESHIAGETEGGGTVHYFDKNKW